jgi:predicted esterase
MRFTCSGVKDWNAGNDRERINVMKVSGRVVVFCCFIWLGGCPLSAVELMPGQEVALPFERAVKPLIVYLPENYDAAKRWPVVFHYHGTGGNPGVAIPRAYTNGKDFILVGMEYATLRSRLAEGDYLDVEIDFLRDVRTSLAEKLSIDLRRCYVGGFSKGGWFGSEFAETYSGEFSGFYILGAGKRKPDKRPVRMFAGKVPVYIGVGQQDINYFYGIKAIAHFRMLGARVTYDEYLAMGHDIPMGRKYGKSEYFSQWWAIEAGRREPSAVKSAAARWSGKKLLHANDIPGLMDRFLFLQKLRAAPFYGLLDKSRRDEISDALAAVKILPGLRRELQAQRAYHLVLKDELKGDGMEHLLEISHRYAGVNTNYEDEHFGRRAGMEILRLNNMIYASSLWRWPSEEAKQKVMAKLKADPPPTIDRDPLLKEFQRLHRMLDGQ